MEMAAATLDLDGSHWRFVVSFYDEPGVAEVCLSLQDGLGLDVNILLFAIFSAAERGIAVTAHDIRDMDMAVDPWRSASVLPLRSIRRQLKHAAEPIPPEYAETLRTKVKHIELLAEQMEQALLARWLASRTDLKEEQHINLADVIRTVIEFFADKFGSTANSRLPNAQAAVQNLLRAVDVRRRNTLRVRE